MVEQYTVLRYT